MCRLDLRHPLLPRHPPRNGLSCPCWRTSWASERLIGTCASLLVPYLRLALSGLRSDLGHSLLPCAVLVFLECLKINRRKKHGVSQICNFMLVKLQLRGMPRHAAQDFRNTENTENAFMKLMPKTKSNFSDGREKRAGRDLN